MLKLAPSILAADFGNLAQELKRIEEAGAHYAHIDVMDGHFVPNISLGVPVVQSMRAHSSLFFDVHLMITDPMAYIEPFAKAGSDLINFHVEACKDEHEVMECINKIRGLGKKVGITIKPETDFQTIVPYLPFVDMLLVMTVNPGFGGQKLIPHCLEKLEKARDFAKQHGLSLDIEADGGIDLSNVMEVIQAGANVIVAGSAVYKPGKTEENVRAFLTQFEIKE